MYQFGFTTPDHTEVQEFPVNIDNMSKVQEFTCWWSVANIFAKQHDNQDWEYKATFKDGSMQFPITVPVMEYDKQG